MWTRCLWPGCRYRTRRCMLVVSAITLYIAIQCVHKYALSTLEGTAHGEFDRSGMSPKSRARPEVYGNVDVQNPISKVSCTGLFTGNQSAVSSALSDVFTQQNLVLQHEVAYKESLQANCSHFAEKRGYLSHPVSQEEQDFPLAFSILLYDNPRQTERLLRAIYRPHNYYCLHVDRKANERVYRDMLQLASCFTNVFLASHRVSVHWGTFSVLEADLGCMRDLLKFASDWKYFINLTGKEFPLRTNAELVSILKLYNGANEVDAKIKGQTEADRRRYQFRYHKSTGDTHQRKEPPPYNVTIVKGSVHVTLSRPFVDFILSDHKTRKFIHWARDIDVPDEMVFSTLNYNAEIFKAPGSFTGAHPDTDRSTKPFLSRYKEWQIRGLPCSGRFVRNICIFGVGDLARIGDQPHFFLNKVYDDVQPQTYDCLEELYFNRTHREMRANSYFDLSFYRKQPAILYHL